jgi:hypothetical protein
MLLSAHLPTVLVAWHKRSHTLSVVANTGLHAGRTPRVTQRATKCSHCFRFADSKLRAGPCIASNEPQAWLVTAFMNSWPVVISTCCARALVCSAGLAAAGCCCQNAMEAALEHITAQNLLDTVVPSYWICLRTTHTVAAHRHARPRRRGSGSISLRAHIHRPAMRSSTQGG